MCLIRIANSDLGHHVTIKAKLKDPFHGQSTSTTLLVNKYLYFHNTIIVYGVSGAVNNNSGSIAIVVLKNENRVVFTEVGRGLEHASWRFSIHTRM